MVVARKGQGNRYHEVLNILCKHGFGYLAQQVREGRFLSWCHLKSSQSVVKEDLYNLPVRIRLVFEELGPTFVKLGQVLSSRPDLIPPEYAEEFSKLQDHVTPMDLTTIQKQIKEFLGAEGEELFLHFQKEPIASASIGQVHLAVLACGDEVAVKVQRPEIQELIKKDMHILKKVQKILQERTILGKVCNVAEIIEFFERQINKEIDFTVEGLNVENFGRILGGNPLIQVPKVYWQYTNAHILTISFVKGIKLAELKDDLSLEQRRNIAENIMYAVLYPFFQAGIFHGDPHPGNLLWTDENQIALLDFGIVGRVELDFRRQVAQLLLALWKRDARRVVDITLEMGQVTGPINEQQIFEDTAELVEKTVVVGRGDIAFGQIIQGVIGISLRHQIKMPSAFLLIGKAILLGEAMARNVYPGFNILTVARPMAMNFYQQDIVPDTSPESFYRQLSNWRKISSTLPQDVSDIIHQTAKGELRLIFYHRNLQWMYDMLEVTSSRIAFSVVIAAMIVGSALIMHASKGPTLYGYPVLGLIGFSFASFMGGWVSIVLLRNIR